MADIYYELYGLKFEWRDDKSALVLNNHKITFTEACTVFFDDNEIAFEDTRFDYSKPHFITIGFSENARLLVVAWVQREDNIRLITAIQAEKKHERLYHTERQLF